MITASQKRKENIAEYLLYMWQIEDLIRAHSLDMDKIKENIIDRYRLSDDQKKEMADWYESLIDMMRREDVKEKGHLQLNKNVIIQLEDLHRALMKEPRFAKYHALFYSTLPYIVELRSKQGDDKQGEIETCFTAMYGVLMLRLRKKEISQDTLAAVTHIAEFLKTLAYYYNLDRDDKLWDDDRAVK